MARTLVRLHRYPVKGMSAERLPEVALSAGRALPCDRRFALAHGAGTVDPARPQWAPKSQFLMLARHARLAELSLALDAERGTLRLRRGQDALAEGAVDDPQVRADVAAAVQAHMGEEAKGAVRLVEAAETVFTDVPEPWVSLINLESIRDLEAAVEAPLDPLRFRANLYYEGGTPWEERDWVGREVQVGSARLRVEEPIGRCAATNVDPSSAARDMNLPRELQRLYGHTEMGVYASVASGGAVREGDALGIA